jgi:outer membrane PBP1 activator LpoA protein
LNTQKYDILRDTWIYQEIRQQVQAEEQQHYLLEQRLNLLEIVRARFPRIKSLVKQIAEQLNEPAQLRSLILKISIAPTEKQAKQALQEFTTEDNR